MWYMHRTGRGLPRARIPVACMRLARGAVEIEDKPIDARHVAILSDHELLLCILREVVHHRLSREWHTRAPPRASATPHRTPRASVLQRHLYRQGTAQVRRQAE